MFVWYVSWYLGSVVAWLLVGLNPLHIGYPSCLVVEVRVFLDYRFLEFLASLTSLFLGFLVFRVLGLLVSRFERFLGAWFRMFLRSRLHIFYCSLFAVTSLPRCLPFVVSCFCCVVVARLSLVLFARGLSWLLTFFVCFPKVFTLGVPSSRVRADEKTPGQPPSRIPRDDTQTRNITITNMVLPVYNSTRINTHVHTFTFAT